MKPSYCVGEVLRSGWITSGPAGEERSRRKLSEYCGGCPVRAFNSGTCTMEIALRIAGGRPRPRGHHDAAFLGGDEQRHPTVGARPVFVDVDPAHAQHLSSPASRRRSRPPRAPFIPVDLSGLPVDRDRLYAIAKKHKLRVIEDAAQAFGMWKGKRIGSIGDFVSFSFHPNKNITTTEGGCLVLNDEARGEIG